MRIWRILAFLAALCPAAMGGETPQGPSPNRYQTATPEESYQYVTRGRGQDQQTAAPLRDYLTGLRPDERGALVDYMRAWRNEPGAMDRLLNAMVQHPDLFEQMRYRILPRFNDVAGPVLGVGTGGPDPDQSAPRDPRFPGPVDVPFLFGPNDLAVPRAAPVLTVPPLITQRVAERNPDFPYGQAAWGEEQARAGNDEGALESFENALRLGQVDSKTLTAHAAAASRLGLQEVAAGSAAEALKLDPSNALAKAIFMLSKGKAPRMDLPSMLEGAGKGSGEGGGQSFRGSGSVTQARSGKPPSEIGRSDQLSRRARASMRSGDYASAAALASEAIRLNPRNAYALNLRALAQLKLGRNAEALADVRAALALLPNNLGS